MRLAIKLIVRHVEIWKYDFRKSVLKESQKQP